MWLTETSKRAFESFLGMKTCSTFMCAINRRVVMTCRLRGACDDCQRFSSYGMSFEGCCLSGKKQILRLRRDEEWFAIPTRQEQKAGMRPGEGYAALGARRRPGPRRSER